jgi:hypothetical protein
LIIAYRSSYIDVRQGKVNVEELEQQIENLLKYCEEHIKQLPKEPNLDTMNQWIIPLRKESLVQLARSRHANPNIVDPDSVLKNMCQNMLQQFNIPGSILVCTVSGSHAHGIASK